MRATLLLAAVAVRAHANPVDAFGFGARGPAMAGAQTAATDDGGANYYNPGALALGDDIRIDLGYQIAKPYLKIGGGDQGVDSSRGLALSLTAPGDVGPVHLAVGLAVFLPDERITRTRTLPSARPRWALYDNRPQRLFLASNLALRVGDDLYIGGGIAYMSRTGGAIDLEGRLGFPDPNDSNFTLDIDVTLKTIRYAQAGVLWRAQPWLLVGASFRGGFVLALDQGFRIHGDLGPAGSPVVKDGFFELHSLAFDLFQPEQWAAGFALQLTPRVLVSGDVTWQRWSAYENPAARIQISYDLKQLNDIVHIVAAPPLEKAYFHDTFVPRLGVEWLAARSPHAAWRVRAGYAFEPTPAPEQRGELNAVDNDKHTFTAGFGVSLSDVTRVLVHPFDIDAYVGATYLPPRTHRKLSLTDPVGDYISEGLVLMAGVGTRWRF
ncbi:MAG TPA: outer membrane protein transport protein [Haliangiales bacterium]|nr:outer membrane protein transport protein [Haliangiales bacterium]